MTKPLIFPWFYRVRQSFFNNFFLFEKVCLKDNYKLVQNYFISITVFQFFPLWDSLGREPHPAKGGGGRGIPVPWKPQVGNRTPTFIFNIFKIIGIRNILNILLIYSLFRILLISSSFLILSDISGLLQGSLANYMFLNLVSQLLLTPNNHEIKTLVSFLEFDIWYLSNLSSFVDCWMMTKLNIDLYTIYVYVS